jgi:hypothetical protein
VSSAVDIHALFQPAPAPDQLARALDALGEAERIDAVARLRRRELAALYEAAAGNAPLRLDDFVPVGVGARTEVIHEGKNSLPLFTRFQKRFCRAGGAGELWGYNEQANRLFTGPGYFVTHLEDGALVIDYRVQPRARQDELPPGWPKVIPNSARLSRFIYNGTVDVMRRVSDQVSIGRAQRNGKPMDAWFALVRCTEKKR